MNEIRTFTTVRVRFTKTGKLKYISHLDLNRTMIRVIRRTKLPIWYTEGFNRHPYVTFVSPLSLGYESVCELMDFRLCEDVPYEVVVEALNREVPEGIKVLSANEPKEKVGKLGFARYQLSFSCDIEIVRNLLKKDEIVVCKRTKKGTMKEIDIRPFLKECNLYEDSQKAILEVTLPCNSVDTVNPSLLQNAIGENIDMEVCRLELFDLDGKIFF